MKFQMALKTLFNPARWIMDINSALLNRTMNFCSSLKFGYRSLFMSKSRLAAIKSFDVRKIFKKQNKETYILSRNPLQLLQKPPLYFCCHFISRIQHIWVRRIQRRTFKEDRPITEPELCARGTEPH